MCKITYSAWNHLCYSDLSFPIFQPQKDYHFFPDENFCQHSGGLKSKPYIVQQQQSWTKRKTGAFFILIIPCESMAEQGEKVVQVID